MPYLGFCTGIPRGSPVGVSSTGTLPDDPCSSRMSGDPKECREHARECLKKARSAPSLPLMAKFQSLAHSWLRLADDLERAEALRDRLKAPTRKAG